MKLHKLITEININNFVLHEYAKEAYFMQINSAITGNLNFINISANINHIQIMFVFTPCGHEQRTV